MSISLSDFPDCYVVVWNPREDRLVTEKASEMIDRNHSFYLRQKKTGVPPWIVVGVARTAEGASQIRMRAGQQLSERTRIPSDDELEEQRDAEDAEFRALKAGKAPKPKPLWWLSEE